MILEGSKGICTLHDNREMQISQVAYSPRSGLQDKGRRSTDQAWDPCLTVVPVKGVRPIPGVSLLGWHDLDLGVTLAGGNG